MALVSVLIVAFIVVEFAPTSVSPVAQRAQAAPATSVSIGYLESIDSLNPFRGLNDPSYLLYGLIYDYLFAFDEDGNVVPNLATSAACTDSTCQNWTYTIRQGVNWSDGTPFTAADVNFTINFNIQNFTNLFAFYPYLNRIVQCTPGVTVACGAIQTGPWQVTVYFDRPFVPGKEVWIPIVQKNQWQGFNGTYVQTGYQNPTPIGTGPFVADPNIFTEWKSQSTTPIHLSRNANFHPVGGRAGPSNITDIYLRQFSDESLMEAALISGTLDLGKFTSDGYAAVLGKPAITTQETLEATQYWNEIGISQFNDPNTTLNPTRFDISMRRALAMATNKDYIVKNFYGGKGWSGTDLISPVTPQWYYNPVADGTNLTFNLAAANSLLNKAGYTTWIPDAQGVCAPLGGNGTVRSLTRAKTVIGNDNIDTNDSVLIRAGTPLALTMGVRSEFKQEKDTANYLQQQWCQIGVSLKVTVESETLLTGDIYGGVFDTYIWYWSGDPDPNYLLSIESGYTINGWNDNYWNNGTFNQLYVDHLAAKNPATRQQIVQAAQRVHYESAVYIVYIYPYGEWAYRNDKWGGWGDWTAHPFRQMDAFWGANPLFLGLFVCAPSCMTAPQGISPLVYGGLGAAVVAIVAIAVFLWTRSRKKTKEEESHLQIPPK